MPKHDNLRRIDQSNRKGTSTPSSGIIMGGGNADLVDGFHASANPVANRLLVLNGDGKVPKSAMPDTANAGTQALGHFGLQYFGATTLLTVAIDATNNELHTLGPVFDGDETVLLSNYRRATETVYLTSGPARVGNVWRYTCLRGQDSSTASSWERGTEVISLGSPSTGGYVRVNSAVDSDSPYIDMYDQDSDRSFDWRLQLGRMNNVPQAFKDLFPTSIDWDTFGLAAENAFLSGGIYAQYGNIAGELDVGGRLTINSPDNDAKIEFGDTVGGWGMVARDDDGNPAWMVVTPYEDESGNASDFAWVVQSEGERAIYYRQVDGSWLLSIGGFDVSETEMSYDDFRIVPDEGRIYWGDGYIYSSGGQFNVSTNTQISGSLQVNGIINSGDSYMNGSYNQFGYSLIGPAITTSGEGSGASYVRKLAFYDVETPIEKPEVTGARDDGTALADLLTELENLGLITDSSTAS